MTTTAPNTTRDLSDHLSELVLSADHLREQLASALGISAAELTALVYLGQHRQINPRALGRRLSLTSGGTTALIDRLERQNYLTRSPHATDRRQLILRLTPNGYDLIDWVNQQYRSSLRAMFAHTTEPDAAILKLLSQASAAMTAAAIAGVPARRPGSA